MARCKNTELVCYLSQMLVLLFQSRFGFSENKSSWFVVSDPIIKRSGKKLETHFDSTLRNRTINRVLSLQNVNTGSFLFLFPSISLSLYLTISLSVSHSFLLRSGIPRDVCARIRRRLAGTGSEETPRQRWYYIIWKLAANVSRRVRL